MNKIIDLVKTLNKRGDCSEIIQKVYDLLNTIYNECDSTNHLLSILYRLIFRTFHQNSDNAYCILSGFIKFGQSDLGKKVKPFLDHLAIEAVDELILLGSWSILKNCLNTLRDNSNDSSIINEPIFTHILTRVVHQLGEDAIEIAIGTANNVSELCCYLPRERSFTWGWFSYYVAHALYVGPNARRERVSSKTMRTYLKGYRQLITRLRRNVQRFDPEIYDGYYIDDLNDTDPGDIDETCTGLLSELSSPEYSWTWTLFDNATTSPEDDDELIIVSSAQEVSAYAAEEAKEAKEKKEAKEAKAIEAKEKKDTTEAAVTTETVTTEAAATTGWLSWLKWS